MRVNRVRTTMKWKTLALLAALLVSTTGLTVATSQPAHAAVQQFTQDCITYQVDDTDTAAGATITDYDPSEGGNEVVISASITYDGVSYAVTIIGDGAFRPNL